MMGIYGAPDIPEIRFKIIMSKEALISLSRRNPLFVCSVAVTLLVLVVGGALTDGGVVGGELSPNRDCKTNPAKPNCHVIATNRCHRRFLFRWVGWGRFVFFRLLVAVKQGG